MIAQFPYKLSLKKSSTDHRDITLCISQDNEILPNKYEIIPRCIYDQSKINSCSSNAIANQIMSLKPHDDNNYVSRLYQYYNSRLIDACEDIDEGTSYRSAYKALKTYGFCDEDLLPYDITKVLDKPSDECYEKANKTLIKKYKSILPSLYSLQYAISNNKPVSIGVAIYDNFLSVQEMIILYLHHQIIIYTLVITRC